MGLGGRGRRGGEGKRGEGRGGEGRGGEGRGGEGRGGGEGGERIREGGLERGGEGVDDMREDARKVRERRRRKERELLGRSHTHSYLRDGDSLCRILH